MLVIALLTIALIIVVGGVFLFVRSVVIKLFSMTALVFALVLVIALNGNNIKEATQPIAFDDNKVILYKEGEMIEIPVNKIQRVDVNNAETGGVVIRLIAGDGQYLISSSGFAYEWRLKNSLNKQFQGRIYDNTF